MGLIARALEAAGTPTICLTSARSITEAARPPRAAFVDHPLGYTAGKPNNPADQREIVLDALQAAQHITPPGIADLGRDWGADAGWQERATGGPDNGVSCATDGDSRRPRLAEPQYQNDADRSAAEG